MPLSSRLASLVLLALMALGLDVIAQDPAGRPDGPGAPPPRPGRPGDDENDFPPPPPPPPGGNPFMRALDLDDDGELSPDEIKKASNSLMSLDRNKDGKLTGAEIRPPRPGGPDGPGGPGGGPPGGGPGGGANITAFVDSFMKNDKNGDGKLTLNELPARLKTALDRGDTNKDKALERSEVEAMARRNNRGPAGRPPGGGPPGGGPPGGGPPGGGPPGREDF